MSTLDPKVTQQLARELRGSILRPGDGGYDEARRVFNGMIDRRPELIVRCESDADIAAAIAFAREQRQAVAVRGGGHNVAGNAVCDGGLVIDLSLMRRVDVDAGNRRARAQGGATWGDFDGATQGHALATPGGIVSSTGVAGLTLGGGIGVLRGLYGLTCDNLVGAELITAAGERVEASAESNPELLWGLRGGGGNFGVVTTFEFALHPLAGVVSGPLDFPYSRDFLAFYDEFVDTIPDEATFDLLLRRTPEGEPLATVLGSFCGPAAAAAPIYERLRSRFRPIRDGVAPRTYAESQRLYDPISPWGLRNYWKTNALGPLVAGAITAAAEAFEGAPSPLSQLQLEHLHGALHRTPAGTNALRFGDAKFDLLVNAKWTDPAVDPENVRWAREGYASLEPFTRAGAYPNYLFQESGERVRQAYGETAYARLVALKGRYDPTNFFRLNQNIEPAMGA
ncbi:MAG TPA: FAD-binding oxidoreductase [Candidatus Micrarchaeaceae archaeon]|nr:FAD-binding oxidoreductase [Candidatus Micrarchaeaceae archaeon]